MGFYSNKLFATGFVPGMPLGELTTRFEEYGLIISSKMVLPNDPEGYAYAFFEFDKSKDATHARSKMHHSVVHGGKLEVHFDTKIPPHFLPMLNDAGSPASPGVTRSNSDDKQQGGSDYSSRVSPSNGEFRQGYQNGNPQDPSKGYDAGRFNDRVGGGVSRPAPRDRYNGAPGYRTGPPRHHAEDGRAPYAPRGRYMSRTPGYRPHYNKGYVPRPPRGAFGDHRGGYQSGYRSRLPYHRGAYMDRESNGAGGYYREYSGHMDSRNHSPGPDRYNNDGGDGYYQTEPTHEQLSANSYEHGGSWEEDRKGAGNWDEGEVRSRHVRSRSMDSNHNNHSLRRSPSPVSRAVDEVIEAQERKQQSGEAGDQDGPGAFNEDSLFTAP